MNVAIQEKKILHKLRNHVTDGGRGRAANSVTLVVVHFIFARPR